MIGGTIIGNSLKILILTDGKIGALVQCRGVAARLEKPSQITEAVVSPNWFHALPLPYIGIQKSDKAGQPNSPMNEPHPDLVIASGRRTIPYLRAFKNIRKDDRHPFLVFLKKPQTHREVPDFIWAPKHDGLTGDHVFSTHTSPHILSEEKRTAATISGTARFSEYQNPKIAIILGGNSGAVKWTDKSANEFAGHLKNIPPHFSVLVTPSRRTPNLLLQAVQSAITDRRHWVWDGEGENPYLQMLAIADQFIVTGDSHNMVSECLTSGHPVYVFRPPNLQPKLHRFLDALEQQKAIADLRRGLTPFSPIQLDVTGEIALEIQKRLKRA